MSRAGLAVAVAGLALVAAAWLWIGSFALLVTGLAVAAAGTGLAGPRARPDPGDRLQRLAIRQLCGAARQLRPGQVLADPVTGLRFRTERDRGYLALAAADPETPPGGDSVVTRYLLSFLRIPVPPPLWRHVQPLHAPGRPVSWREAHRVISFDMDTGASDLTPAELAELIAAFGRACSTAPPDHR
jgi:hypothetical protein